MSTNTETGPENTRTRSFLAFTVNSFFTLAVVTVFWGLFLLLCFLIAGCLAHLIGLPDRM